MDYIIRDMPAEERYLLNDFLYEAIYIPEGVEKSQCRKRTLAF